MSFMQFSDPGVYRGCVGMCTLELMSDVKCVIKFLAAHLLSLAHSHTYHLNCLPSTAEVHTHLNSLVHRAPSHNHVLHHEALLTLSVIALHQLLGAIALALLAADQHRNVLMDKKRMNVCISKMLK